MGAGKLVVTTFPPDIFFCESEDKMAEEKPKPAKPVKKAVAKAAPAKKPATAKAATPRAAAKPKPVEKAPKATGPTTTATQSLKDGAAKLTQEATGKARAYAEDGKARVGGVLDELSRMMGDAAGTVDEKVGAQYGNYARSAADAVSGFLGVAEVEDMSTTSSPMRATS